MIGGDLYPRFIPTLHFKDRAKETRHVKYFATPSKSRLPSRTGCRAQRHQRNVCPPELATALLEAIIEPGVRVAIEGDNQKRADFLASLLASVDPTQFHRGDARSLSIPRRHRRRVDEPDRGRPAAGRHPQGLGLVIPSPKPYLIDPLFTPTPPRVLDENILMKRDPNR
jgi:hypothetical protein